jgi:hypothetical protein
MSGEVKRARNRVVPDWRIYSDSVHCCGAGYSLRPSKKLPIYIRDYLITNSHIRLIAVCTRLLYRRNSYNLTNFSSFGFCRIIPQIYRSLAYI